MKPSPEPTSSQPYLIRAWHEWCTDNGLTPYVTVAVDGAVQVPREYVKDGEIVLNISYDSTTGLQIGNDYLEFKARFAGVARDVMVPVDRVLAIFARENGQGMAFPKAVRQEPVADDAAGDAGASESQAEDSAGMSPAQTHLASVPEAASKDSKKPKQKPPAKSTTGARPTLTRIK